MDGDVMKVMTIKEFAEEQKVSYEAIRKQIVRYQDELKDHISVTGRTQYLDEWAVDFLKKRRREQPVILMNQDKDEEIESLKRQVDSLRSQLMSAQNELLKEKDRVISLQDEARKTIEDRARYTALLEDSKAKEEKLKESESRGLELTRQIGKMEDQIRTIQAEADYLRKKAEADQDMIKGLQRQCDDARTEADSYHRSIFGFYRKVKG